MSEHLESILKGDRTEAWELIRAVEVGGLDADATSLIRGFLVDAFGTAEQNLKVLVAKIASLGYRFAIAANASPISPIDDYTSRARNLYRMNVGSDPPLVLDVFWEVVGTVRLVGTFPNLVPPLQTGPGIEGSDVVYGDPLCVYGPADAVSDVQPGQDGLVRFVDISPDAATKAHFGGGEPYGFAVPTDRIDPVIENVPWSRGLTFSDYLRVSITWGGFPGFSPSHQRGRDEMLVDEGREQLPGWLRGLRALVTPF